MESINSAVFTVSKRAKYQRITICPDKTIKVTIPENGSFTEAKRFLKSKSGWVRKQLKKIDERAKLRNEPR
jgi:predicted metal-dependent hydrolase